MTWLLPSTVFGWHPHPQRLGGDAEREGLDDEGQIAAPTSTGSGVSSTPNSICTRLRMYLASSRTSSADAPPSFTMASECLCDIRAREPDRRKPRETPAC